MSKERQVDLPLYLFERRLRWHEFPPETRQRLTRLFGALCVEIVDQSHLPSRAQEQGDERTED